MSHKGLSIAGFSQSLFTLMLGPVAQFGMLIVLSRMLSLDEMGIYFMLTALMPALSALAGLGGHETALRGIARAPHETREWLGSALILSGLTVPAVVMLYVLLMQLFPDHGAVGPLLALAAVEMTAQRGLAIAESVALARGEVSRADRVRASGMMSRLAALCLVWAMVPDPDAWTCALAVAAGALTLSGIAMARCLVRYGMPRWVRPKDLRGSLYFTANAVLRACQNSADRFVLALLLPPAALALYSVATRALQVTFIPLQIVSRRYIPRYFEYGHHAPEKLPGLARHVLQLMTLVALLEIALLWALAPLSDEIFGADYAPVITFLRWASPVVLLTGLFYVGHDILNGLDRQKARIMLNIMVAIAHVAVMICVVHWVGPEGLWASLILVEILAAGMAWSLLGLKFLRRAKQAIT
jgi:O-antigen/teichoic acid export membrane protein